MLVLGSWKATRWLFGALMANCILASGSSLQMAKARNKGQACNSAITTASVVSSKTTKNAEKASLNSTTATSTKVNGKTARCRAKASILTRALPYTTKDNGVKVR